MQILFVLDQLPYPPRNGVTVPTYNYLRGLAERHDVSLLFVRRNPDEDLACLDENKALVANFWTITAPKRPAWFRIGNELRGQSMFHMGRRYDETELRCLCGGYHFDAIWVSDDGLLDVVYSLKRLFREAPVYVAGINDAITGVFRGAIRNVWLVGLTPLARILLVVKWLRSWRIGAIENRLLEQYDFIPVQSEADKRMLEKISRGGLADKVMVLPNGVDSSLFSVSSEKSRKDLLFVGSLRGYGPIVEWLMVHVWPAVSERHPDATMTIIGRGASERLKKQIEEARGVSHIPFLENLQDVYRGRMVAILPVRKSWGLINKVIESMAAGVPVVGDTGSFNSIPDFQDGVHGVVAKDAESMIQAVTGLIDNEKRRSEMADAARNLIRQHFVWKDRIDRAERRIQELSNQTQ